MIMKYNIIISVLLLFLLFLFFPIIHAQENNPILVNIDESIEKEKIIVFDESLTDSLKVVFNVKVTFKYPLKDTIHCVIIDSVELVKMKVISLGENKTIIDFAYDKKHSTEYQRNIWDMCSIKIRKWYLNQPYCKMTDRKIWDKIVGFGGVVYFMPK